MKSKEEILDRWDVEYVSEELREYYSSNVLAAMQEYADLQTASLRQERDILSNQVDNIHGTIVQLKEELEIANQEVDRLQAMVNVRDQKIKSLSARVSELQGEVGMWEVKWDDLKKLYDEETTLLRNRIKALTK